MRTANVGHRIRKYRHHNALVTVSNRDMSNWKSHDSLIHARLANDVVIIRRTNWMGEN